MFVLLLFIISISPLWDRNVTIFKADVPKISYFSNSFCHRWWQEWHYVSGSTRRVISNRKLVFWMLPSMGNAHFESCCILCWNCGSCCGIIPRFCYSWYSLFQETFVCQSWLLQHCLIFALMVIILVVYFGSLRHWPKRKFPMGSKGGFCACIM